MTKNRQPEPKNNSKAVEDETNRIMAKHEREQRQQISDEEHRAIMDRLRDQYGTDG